VEIVTNDLESYLAEVLKVYSSCFKTGLGLQGAQRLSFNNLTSRAVANFLLSQLIKVEAISPGASDLMLDMLISDDLIVDSCVKLREDNLKKLLSTFVDESLWNLAYDALTLAGLTGKVVLMKHQAKQDKDSIELNSGSFFPDVMPVLKLKNSKFIDPKIVCIDGYVESVSEIHRILEDASRLKDSVFLFLRGASPDVTHTLKVNYDRGTLSVIPFIVNYDLDGVNLLNDIAIVSGGDVVSSLKGQLISSVDISTCPRVDYVNLSDTGVLIEKKSTVLSVSLHVSHLQKKLLETEADAGKDLLAKRIKNLGSNRVTISLRHDENIAKRSFMVDRALRATKAALTHGVAVYRNKLYPLTSLKIAKHYRDHFLNDYRNLGCVVPI